MRMVSLAPNTLADDLVPAIVTVAAVARVDFRNDRRFGRVMGRTSAAAGREGEGNRSVERYPRRPRRANSFAPPRAIADDGFGTPAPATPDTPCSPVPPASRP